MHGADQQTVIALSNKIISLYLINLTIYTASLISADEPSLFIGYLAAEGSGDDGCLHRSACKAPKRTTEYLRAAKAILKGAEMFDATIAYNSHYHDVVQKAERAVLDGMTGAPCEAIYPCRL